jgi:membrane protein implicated in regulation of membrane protease activity
MYIVVFGWLYVALLMAAAEATHPAGTTLGAIVTFVLYGLLPVILVLYLMGTPGRKRAIRTRELAEANQRQESFEPDADRHAPAATQGGSIAPVRKEP